jgi:hypothetical protein
MKNHISKLILAIFFLPSIFAITSCKSKKCVKCEYDYDGIKGNTEHCFSSNKEAKDAMKSWTRECMETGRQYDSSLCACKRVENL